ncbi:MAG: CBS domain-containing protein [Alphaproteobacteria bacterium]|nr:MAG: CBS domain-containing protein [Alphaproteobacteria bacterium]
MKVQAMLAQKGDKIITVRPDATIETAIRLLKMEGIGALVVSDDGRHVQGILSERDVVRGLVTHGSELLQMHVADLMTRAVKTCTPADDVKNVMSEMTRSRIRHLPVVEGDKLVGIISIGDVVKNRLDELETETTVLRDYIVGRT